MGNAALTANLVILASGSGRTVENLAECIAHGSLPARITGVVASRADAGVVDRCRRLQLPVETLGRTTHPDRNARDAALVVAVNAAEPDWIVLAGWLQLLPMPGAWKGKVINIHPALLPAFGGQGFYGHHVHEAVVASGAAWSGCTVHFLDPEYDQGAVVLQEAVPILSGDDPQALADRVFAAEKRVLPEALLHLIRGRVCLQGKKVLWQVAPIS